MHGAAPERAQLSVAELLGRNEAHPSARPGAGPTSVPESWPLPVGSSRLRLARTAGAYLVAGTVVCAAAFGGHPSEGPTMGAETADGGPPTGVLGGADADAPEPPVHTERPRTTASDTFVAPSRPRPPRTAPAARVAPVVTHPVQRPAAPRHRPRVQRDDDDRLSVPAGSALSSLTRPIVGSDSLLGGLG